MDAVISHDFEEWSVESVPDPSPEPDEVLIEVRRVQLSVTECSLFLGESSWEHETVAHRMHEGDGRVLGHEFCGEVIEVGSEVTELSVGDRVYAPGSVPCHECPQCRHGYTHFCANKQNIGWHRPGALAEYVALPSDALCRLPEEVSDAEGAALQPFANSVLAAIDADVGVGDVVAVMGVGVMGYQLGQLAQNMGADEVYAINRSREKLDLAADRGMVPIEIGNSDPVEAVTAATDEVGADVVFECVGGSQSHMTEGDDPLAQCFRMTRTGGTLVQIGILTQDITITPLALYAKSLRWVNPRIGVLSPTPNADVGEIAASAVASDRVSIDEYITHELDGLSSFGDAVDITMNKKDHGARGPAQMVLKE